MDKPMGGNAPFGYTWQDGELEHEFTIDFLAAKLGTPHQMRFGAYSLYGQ